MPGADLKRSILDFAKQNSIAAGTVMTCVGSLKQVNIRFANQQKGTIITGFFEIVSLVGTFSTASGHFHISVANEHGQTIGGHLLEDNLVYTTAEVAVTDMVSLEFCREMDSATGYRELVVNERT